MSSCDNSNNGKMLKITIGDVDLFAENAPFEVPGCCDQSGVTITAYFSEKDALEAAGVKQLRESIDQFPPLN